MVKRIITRDVNYQHGPALFQQFKAGPDPVDVPKHVAAWLDKHKAAAVPPKPAKVED